MDFMGIAGLSTSLKLSQTQSDVGVAMLSKAMDTNEAIGQGVVEMLNAAPRASLDPNVGNNFHAAV